MTRLRCLAPGKVNLCLFVGRPRADGYHPLVSLVQPLALADELELEPARGASDEVVCPGVEGENLAAQAIARFRAVTGWDGPPVRITIAKRVPVAAGMGGGSADVPSQLAPERCLMTGIGEGVRPLGDPAPFGVVIVPSAHTLSTPSVYGEFDRLGLGRNTDELDRLSGQVPGAARDASLLAERLLHNDLEAPARSLCPPIGEALADVRASGAVRAMVSGSGPTVFGLFGGEEGVGHAQAAAAALRRRHPHAVAATPVGRLFAAARAA